MLNFYRDLLIFLSFFICSFAKANTVEVFPKAQPLPRSKWILSLEGDFLYWMAIDSGLGFAQTNNSIVTKERFVPYHFDPGYKIQVSIYPNFDGADLSFRYTWYQQKERSLTYKKDPFSSSENDPTHAICLISPFDLMNDFIDPSIILTQGKMELLLTSLDLELGKKYKLSPQLFLRPYLGLKSVWQHQKVHLNYINNSDPILYDEEKMDLIQHSIGIGPRTGLDLTFRFTQQFALIFNSAFSLISTRFNDRINSDRYVEGFFEENVYDFTNKVSNCQPVLELLGGLSMDRYYQNKRFHIGYFIGWEVQYYGENNQFFIHPKDQRSGSLSVQGLNIKIQADF